jgi:hypothetical protein
MVYGYIALTVIAIVVSAYILTVLIPEQMRKRKGLPKMKAYIYRTPDGKAFIGKTDNLEAKKKELEAKYNKQ